MAKPDSVRMVVLGEGLAAGMANFSLIEADQVDSFPAQMAKQMNATFVQPLLQAPGLGDAPGFPRLPVRLPFDHQTTVLKEFPPSAPHANLSIPCLTVADAVTRRPTPPVVRADDALQTAVNLVVGMTGSLVAPEAARPTPLEYAVAQKPTLAIVELGFAEALEAAAARRPDLMPRPDAFKAQYAQIVAALRAAGATVVVATIPDPCDTAHYSPIDAAARVLKVPAEIVAMVYGLQPGDRIAVDTLTEMGYQLICKSPKPLPEACFLRAAAAAGIGAAVNGLNGAITAVAREHGAVVYDLHAFYKAVREEGVAVGAKKLTADFLGGFYSLNGYYPGKAGHALVANGVLALVNKQLGTDFQPIDVEQVAGRDPVAAYRAAQGPDFSPADLMPPVSGGSQAAAAKGFKSEAEHGPYGPPPETRKLPLKLPLGLEQVLPLSKEASYYGDALRPVHTTDPAEIPYGLSGNLLFGGLALLDSHLAGQVRIKFTPPVNDVTHFEVTHGEGLVGDDGRLSAPQFFKLPGLMNKLLDPPDVVSSGDLNLATGEVSNLKYRLFFMNSAIFALAQVNPSLPKVPMEFPGQYGSTWARFEQRADGLLDFEMYATTFIPMSVFGGPARFPLPFVSPTMDFASIPCDGTALHPHIHLSTKPPEAADPGVEAPALPVNTIEMFTCSSHNNYFGDDFSLNAPELGSPGSGRSHLVGRYQIQFGERCGNSQSFSIQSLQPGGQMMTLPQSPVAQAFGKRIPDSLLGHDEWLRFREQTYNNNIISWLDDPLDIAVGQIDLKTGKVIGHLLRRGMITTSWILAMVFVEPRTPRSTFQFRGPASFEKGVNGETVFRYHGDLHIPFPEGFNFPTAAFTSAFMAFVGGQPFEGEKSFPIGPKSALDPYLRFQAMHAPTTALLARRGGSRQTTSTNGIDFSYKYDIVPGGESSFEFRNITNGGTFRLTRLTWLDFLNSRRSSAAAADYDTFTFSGLGTWSEDPSGGVHVATVHISTSPSHPFVSVLIDGGVTTNVETRPPNRDITLP